MLFVLVSLAYSWTNVTFREEAAPRQSRMNPRRHCVIFKHWINTASYTTSYDTSINITFQCAQSTVYIKLHCNSPHRSRSISWMKIIILQIQENSPAEKAGLEPFFDFIISIGHNRLVSLHYKHLLIISCHRWLGSVADSAIKSTEPREWHAEGPSKG